MQDKLTMKVLVVGSGGREHALCWKLSKSPKVSEVLCAPGNPGTAQVARNVDVAPGDTEGLLALASTEAVALVVIGPEDPLVGGLADRLREAGIPVFGPGADGAQLEGSKIFSKSFLDRYRIPTAAARQFDRSGAAKSYLEGCTTWPQVVKADGLAAGKGVYVCADVAEGLSAINVIMEECRHGDAGARVLIEEFMDGEEASVFAVTDGKTILIMEAVQDHKQVGDGDQGPNTGGMGVHSPVDVLNERLHKQIEQRVLVQTLHGLRQEGIDYRGVLFVGLMLTDSGPRVVEYNVRFGDPECQALMMRLEGDLFPILLAAANGDLASIDPPNWDRRAVIGVVAAAKGYPGTTQSGDRIHGLEEADAVDDAMVFHAGTRAEGNQIHTSGGRVLCVTALGADKEEARLRAYEAYDLLEWDGKFCRRDIGSRAEARAALQAAAEIKMELLRERD
ncbi:MAG: phosphoribosylamine--glycine ligase [Planctomycetota bacterium]|nr:phosphoribosylamine--glycine ligase [Planctomycetota bacterium]